MEKLTENPGFNQLVQNIFIYLNYNTLLSCRMVNHSIKKNIDSPNFWLTKMSLSGMSRKRYLNWCRLIDRLENIPNDYYSGGMKEYHEKTTLSLMKMFRNYPNSYFLPLIPDTVGTILHISVYNGHTEIVKSLINCIMMNNIGETYRNQSQMTPLHYSTKNGHTEVVKILLKNFGLFERKSRNGMTATHFAAQSGHIEIVKCLVNYCVQNGRFVNIVNEYGRTPIHLAAQNGHIEIVKILIQFADYPVDPDYYGRTPIHLSAKNGHSEIVKILAAQTSNPNSFDMLQQTPIYYAAKKCHALNFDSNYTKIIKSLLCYHYAPTTLEEQLLNDLGFKEILEFPAHDITPHKENTNLLYKFSHITLKDVIFLIICTPLAIAALPTMFSMIAISSLGQKFYYFYNT